MGNIKCQNCGLVSDSSSQACRRCNAKLLLVPHVETPQPEIKQQYPADPTRKKMSNTAIFIVSTLGFLFVILYGLIAIRNMKPAVPSTAQANKPVLELVGGDFDFTAGEYGSKKLEGKIQNNTNKTYSYASITFNLYDKDGAQVGTAMDNITNLEAHGVWKFKALVSEKDATRAKIKDISGF